MLGLLALCLLLSPAFVACARQARPELPLAQVDIAGQTVLAEVPATVLERYQGLGGRRSLEPGRGMLFFFFKGEPRAMCMRDMRFALDFIWLAGGRVSEVTARVPPGGAGLVIKPTKPADLVLEVPAGWARDNGVRPGQAVRITPLGRAFPPSLSRRLSMESHE